MILRWRLTVVVDSANWLGFALIIYYLAAFTSAIKQHKTQQTQDSQNTDNIELDTLQSTNNGPTKDRCNSSYCDAESTTMSTLLPSMHNPQDVDDRSAGSGEGATGGERRNSRRNRDKNKRALLGPEQHMLPCHRIVATILYSTVSTPVIINSLLFYALCFPWSSDHYAEENNGDQSSGESSDAYSSHLLLPLTIHQHVVCPVIILVDLFLSRHPLRKLQFVYANVLILLYGVMSILYYMANITGDAISVQCNTRPGAGAGGGILGDKSKGPWLAVGIGGAVIAFIAVPLLQVIFCELRKLQEYIITKLKDAEANQHQQL